jgi:Reverse transcriptase (RNA-dependent DNA polymerase)
VDFQELYSPIVNDTIWRMMLVLQIALKLGSRIIDIETAFLNGELSEEIYMNAPKGLDTDDDECVLLLKSSSKRAAILPKVQGSHDQAWIQTERNRAMPIF